MRRSCRLRVNNKQQHKRNILLEPDEPSDSAHGVNDRSGQCVFTDASKFTNEPTALQQSPQSCSCTESSYLQTLIHILTFLKARAKGEGTDTPIFVLYFFLLEQSSQGTFPNSAASGQRGNCRCVPFQNQRGFIEPHLTTKNIWMKTQPSSKA